MSTAATEVTPSLPRHSATRGSTSRPRGSARRGGPNRAGISKSPDTSDWATAQEEPETSEEVAQLKSKYATQLKALKEIFPDWTAEDLVYALQEVDGDISLATDRIAGGKFPM